MAIIGTIIQLSKACPYRPGAEALVISAYNSPMGKGWCVRFDDGEELAIFDRHIAR